MATDTRTQEYLGTLEYVLDSKSKKKHYVYPMESRLYLKVQALFKRINIDEIIGNYPSILLDEHGQPKLSESGEEITDTSAFEALQELLEIALKEPWETTDSWITLRQIEEVLHMFQGLSGLLVKKRMLEQEILTTGFSVQA